MSGFREDVKASNEVIMEEAANYRRKLALKIQDLGDVEAPILYKNDVLRKLIQESKDKKLGIGKKNFKTIKVHSSVCRKHSGNVYY